MDGGYYAIKGFEYQIDKSLIEILSTVNEDDYVSIEHIQDIDSEVFVTQVKYKETAKFVPSSIKKPIVQLFEEFKLNTSKSYILYCHFNDLNGYDKNITIDKILGSDKNKYSDADKKAFRKKLTIDFSSDFQTQFEGVIDKLVQLDLATSKEHAIITYGNLVDYIRKKIIDNPPGNEADRKCSRKEISDLIKSNKRIVFNSALIEYNGRKKYLSYIKEQVAPLNKKRNNALIFGAVRKSTTLNLVDLISGFISKYFYRATYDIKPLIIIVQEEDLGEIKKHLIEQGILFNDGYESIGFNEQVFFSKPIINKKTSGNGRATQSLDKISFKVRLISIKTFEKISAHSFLPDRCYLFDTNVPEQYSKVSTIRIDSLYTSEIQNLRII